jgi:hypothetical protein
MTRRKYCTQGQVKDRADCLYIFEFGGGSLTAVAQTILSVLFAQQLPHNDSA